MLFIFIWHLYALLFYNLQSEIGLKGMETLMGSFETTFGIWNWKDTYIKILVCEVAYFQVISSYGACILITKLHLHERKYMN